MSYSTCGDLEDVDIAKLFFERVIVGGRFFMGKKLTKEEFIKKVNEKNEHVRNGEVEIIGEFINTSNRIKCYCNKHNVLWNPIADSLYKNIGCRECAKDGISQKNSMTHQEYVDGINVRNPGIKILTEYTGMYDNITVELKCGHTWTTKATQIYYRDFQCPYCTSNAVLAGFNDLWTTAPYVAELLTNSEDGYVLTKNSGQRKSFTCPLCGKSQFKFVSNVYRRGLQCSFCGDGISYPNKFCRAFLDQLPINDYDVEWQPNWAKPYFYDNAFSYNSVQYILEADGNLHYSDKNEFGVSLEERQKIDNIKNQLAQENGIIVIRIDCRESDCSYIKKNILTSELNNIFDLSAIDWSRCDEKAQKSFVKIACDLYASGIKSTDEISKIIKVGRGAVIGYLKKGTEFGWCDYNPKNAHKGTENKKKRKPILATNIESGKEYYFDGVCTCKKTMHDVCGIKVNGKSIHDALKFGKSYKGFVFNYTNLTTQN